MQKSVGALPLGLKNFENDCVGPATVVRQISALWLAKSELREVRRRANKREPVELSMCAISSEPEGKSALGKSEPVGTMCE